MGRTKRQLAEPCCYHLTHRCQERRFFLRFDIDRRNYLRRLREASLRYAVDVLDYMVTANHVHLLLWAERAAHVSAAMHFLEGNVARDYNRRKGREGALWRGRYHPTLIQTGSHLSRCLFYIDLNMVRAGVVQEPSAWFGGAHAELCGQRKRYRIINLPRLLNCLGFGTHEEEFRRWYAATLQTMVAGAYLTRERVWTEAAAIGTKDWLAKLAVGIRGVEFKPLPVSESPVGMLAESSDIYSLHLSNREQRQFWTSQQKGG